MTARERATLNRLINTNIGDLSPVDGVDLIDRALTILAKDFVANNDALWVEPEENKIVEFNPN